MGASSTNTLPCTGLVPRLSQQSPFTVFHEKLTKPEETEALSIQMFVARLTKNQDKFLVRIRPHLSARKALNEAIAALDDLARSQGRWDQTCARYPRARQGLATSGRFAGLLQNSRCLRHTAGRGREFLSFARDT